jgi:uncharacterized FlgJ-related protein
MKRKGFLLTLVLFFISSPLKTNEMLAQTKENVQENITHESLYEQIIKFGIKFPDVVFAQAVLESGHFTSKLFQSANNLFGMKIPTKRESSAIGQTKSGYSKYDDWNFSVYDYFLWQDYMLKRHGDLTKSQYLALLGRIYAEDKRYVSSIKRVIGEHQRILN